MKHIKSFIVLIMAALPFVLAAQTPYFEGAIIYDLVFQDKTGSIPAAQVKMLFGTEQSYFAKGNKYKSVMNGALQLTQTYPGRDTLYTQMQGVKALTFVDVRHNADSLLSYEIKEDTAKFCGYPCRLLVVRSKDGELKYWFSPKVTVDAALFRSHEHGFWRLTLELTGGALPLKMIGDFSKAYIETTAKVVVPQALDDGQFVLPVGLPLVPAPR